MPVYEYKGNRFESDHELSQAEWSQTLAYFDSLETKPVPKEEPKKEKSFLEQEGLLPEAARSLDTAARGIADMVVTTPNLLLGGIQGALGFEDARDATFKRMEDTQKILHAGEVKPQTLVGGAVAGAAPVLAAVPLGGAGIGTMLTAGFGKQGQQLVSEGVDPTTAAAVAGIDTAGNLAGALVPGGRIAQAVANPVFGAGTDVVNQQVLQKMGYDQVAEQYDPLNPERRLTDAIVGGVLPPPVKAKETSTSDQKSRTYGEYSTDTKETPYGSRNDVLGAIEARKTNKQGIVEQLKRQQDPSSEYSMMLMDELVRVDNEIKVLEEQVGLREKEVPTVEQTKPVEDSIEVPKEAPESIQQKKERLAQLQDQMNADIDPYDKMAIRNKVAAEKEYWSLRKEISALEKEQPPVEQPKEPVGQSILDRVSLINELESFVDHIRKTNPDPLFESYWKDGGDTDRGVARYIEKYFNQLPEKLKEQLQGENVRDLETGEQLNALTDSIRGGHVGQLRRLREEVYDGLHGTIPKQKSEFVQGTTRSEVNELFNGRDISGFSTEILTNMYNNKERKIAEVKDIINREGLGSENGQRALAFLDMLRQEQDVISQHLSKKQTDFNEILPNKTEGYLPDEAIASSMISGNIRGALTRIVDLGKADGSTGVSKGLGKLAETLLNNPLIGRGTTAVDPTLKFDAGYDNTSGTIYLKGADKASPINVLHEVVHSAVNKALTLYKEGKLTNFAQMQAARTITNLHQSLTTHTAFMDALGKALGSADKAKIVMENTKEFVAHGTTDYRVQEVLQNHKLGGQTLFSKLGNAIKNALGLKGEERTAFDELMLYSQRMIELSDGTAPKQDGFSFNRIPRTPKQLAEAIQYGAMHVFAHGFTQNMRQMMRNNPYFAKVEKFVSDANWSKEALDISTLFGEGQKTKQGFFFKLAGPQSEKAIVPAMYDLKNTEIAAVHSGLMEGYRKGIPVEESIKNNPNWTDKQVNFAKALSTGYKKLAEAAWRMYGKTGLPQGLAERVGYMLTTRTGEHHVTVSVMGIPIRKESYLTKAEAEYRKQHFAKDKTVAVEYTHAKDVDGSKSIFDLMESLHDVPQDQIHAHLTKKLEEMERMSTDIGGHQKHSTILAGFTGDQFGLSPERQGQLLRDAIPRAVKQYSQNIATREIRKQLTEFMIDHGHKLDKTTESLINFFVQSQVGKPYLEGGVRSAMHDLSTSIRELVSTGIDKTFGFNFRDKHAMDRFFGLFQNVFSVFNITMKPAIWIAQPLQALNSLRSAFKEGESPRQVSLAMGKTLQMLASGAKNADPEFLRGLQHVAEKHNTLHPQMINEYNDMHFGTNPNSIPNYIMDVVTGKRISAAGDKFSRFASYTFFYNLHQQSGLKGEALWKKAAQDATENMVAYGNKNLPAIYRETGLFGEQASPLATFTHAYLGNMIVDIKEFIQKPSARTVAPVMITGLLATMLGGAISAPLLAEYELLRLAGIKMGWWGATTLPSVRDWMNTHAPATISHGVLSTQTGIDMDASMRYTSLMQKIGDIESQGMLAFFPHLAWGSEAVKSAPTVAKAALGMDVNKAELDQALKKTMPKGWPTGVVDTVRNQDAAFTRTGAAGGALVERGTPEKVAPWIGSRSLAEAMSMEKHLQKQAMDKDRNALIKSAAQSFANNNMERFNDQVQTLIRDHKMSDVNSVVSAVKTQIENENMPLLQRDYFGKGQMSKTQREAFLRDDMAAFLKKYQEIRK